MRGTNLALIALAALGLSTAAAAEISADRKAERMQQRFERLDLNSDGKVTREEMTRHRADRLKSADRNDDGLVSKEEFSTAMLARMREHLERRFAKMDADGDGSLSDAEIGKTGGKRGRHFQRLDADGDGALTLEEMKAGKRHYRGADRPAE